MAHHADTEVDRALEVVVSEINSLVERQDGGPPVVLTVGGLVIGGTIIPDWQWFDEVEHAARAAFTVHTGGPIDDEHGAAQSVMGGVSERYRGVLAGEDRTTYIHLGEAGVFTAGVSPVPPGGMHWRGGPSEGSRGGLRP